MDNVRTKTKLCTSCGSSQRQYDEITQSQVCASCGLVFKSGGHLVDDPGTSWVHAQLRDFDSDRFIHALVASRSSRPPAPAPHTGSHAHGSPIKPGATIASPAAKIARLGIDLSALDRSFELSPPPRSPAVASPTSPAASSNSSNGKTTPTSTPPSKSKSRRSGSGSVLLQPDKSKGLRDCLSEMAALCRHFQLARDVQSLALQRLADAHPYFKQRPMCTQLLHTAACLQLVCASLRPPRRLALLEIVRALPSSPLAPDAPLIHSVLVETHKFFLQLDTRSSASSSSASSLQTLTSPTAANQLDSADYSDEPIGHFECAVDAESSAYRYRYAQLVEHLECLFDRAIDENALAIRPDSHTLQNAKRLLRVLHALSESSASELSRRTLPSRSFAVFALYIAYLSTAFRAPASASASACASATSGRSGASLSLSLGRNAGGAPSGRPPTAGPMLKSRARRATHRKQKLPAAPIALTQFTRRLRLRSASPGVRDVLPGHAALLVRALQAEFARRSPQLLEALGLARLPAEQFEARLPLCLGDLLDTLNIDANAPFVVRAAPEPPQTTPAVAVPADEDANVKDEECDGDEEIDESEIDSYLRTDEEIERFEACERDFNQ